MKKRKILITGIAGFAGSHLAELLYGKAELWGTRIDDNLVNIAHLPGLRLVKCDLLDSQKVSEAIGGIRPDWIFHLAAQSSPALSFERPGETLKTNIFSTLNILEAVRNISPETSVLSVGSGDVYGEVPEGCLPVKETSELRPTNPYAVSKVTSDLLAFQYWKARGIKVIRCRPFNHFGPRQSDQFVISSFARQIAEIEAGIKKDKVLKVGNLEAAKDFLYVKDVVRAYSFLMDRGSMGEAYNICSGKAVRISGILETLLGMANTRIEVVKDPARLRAKDATVVYGDPSRITALGWSPEYTLEQGLKEHLDYWRTKVIGLAGRYGG